MGGDAPKLYFQEKYIFVMGIDITGLITANPQIRLLDIVSIYIKLALMFFLIDMFVVHLVHHLFYFLIVV